MKLWLCRAVFFFVIFAGAELHASAIYESYCQRVRSPERMREYLSQRENILAFNNSPDGLFGGGICWWHSRFERNAAYMAMFVPFWPKPNAAEVDSIIRKIISGTQIAQIPGYANMYEFSLEHRERIVWHLERWQISQGVVGGGWLRGIRGSTEVTAFRLHQKMIELYADVVQGRMPFQVLFFPGLISHAWVVVDMIPNSRGFEMVVLDSNSRRLETYQYQFGMTQFWYRDVVPFVPYTTKDKDIRNMSSVLSRYCKRAVEL